MILRSSPIPKELFQPDSLLASCEDDVDLAREVVEDFFHSTLSVLNRLTLAIAEGDAAQAHLEAHSLKGSAQTLGAEALAWAGLHLENAAKRGSISEMPSLLAQAEGEFHRLCPRLQEFLRTWR